MPATTAHLEPDERHQIATARGAILGVYLFALLICSCRVSVLPLCLDKSNLSITNLKLIYSAPHYAAGTNGHPVIKLYVRRCILHAFQTDDWACMAAILATTTFGALSLAVIEYGAGRHLANIAMDDARIFYYVRYRIYP